VTRLSVRIRREHTQRLKTRAGLWGCGMRRSGAGEGRVLQAAGRWCAWLD
jgi:hypothetical protein